MQKFRYMNSGGEGHNQEDGERSLWDFAISFLSPQEEEHP